MFRKSPKKMESKHNRGEFPVIDADQKSVSRRKKVMNALKCAVVPTFGMGSARDPSSHLENDNPEVQLIDETSRPNSVERAPHGLLDRTLEAVDRTIRAVGHEKPFADLDTSISSDHSLNDKTISFLNTESDSPINLCLSETNQLSPIRKDSLGEDFSNQQLSYQISLKSSDEEADEQEKQLLDTTITFDPDAKSESTASLDNTNINLEIKGDNSKCHQSKHELDLALKHQHHINPLTQENSRMQSAKDSYPMASQEEIMENAKLRRAQIEHLHNQQALEPTEGKAIPQDSLQTLMKRIDKLSKYLYNDESDNDNHDQNEESVVTGLDSQDASNSSVDDAPFSLDHNSTTQKAIFEVNESQIDFKSGLFQLEFPISPQIQPSTACQATTLRPIFWRSHPKQITASSLTPKNAVQNRPIMEGEKPFIVDNIPRVSSQSVPTVSAASMVVLTPKSNSLGKSILRVLSEEPPPPLELQGKFSQQRNASQSPARQRIANRAATTRFAQSFDKDLLLTTTGTTTSTTKSATDFPSIPPKATCYERNEDLVWMSANESNEWSADSKWAVFPSDSSSYKGGHLKMSEI